MIILFKSVQKKFVKSIFIKSKKDNIHYNAWDEITYPFPNFNGATIEVLKWIGNFIPEYLYIYSITYPCWN